VKRLLSEDYADKVIVCTIQKLGFLKELGLPPPRAMRQVICRWNSFWIPAFAGMMGGNGNDGGD